MAPTGGQVSYTVECEDRFPLLLSKGAGEGHTGRPKAAELMGCGAGTAPGSLLHGFASHVGSRDILENAEGFSRPLRPRAQGSEPL